MSRFATPVGLLSLLLIAAILPVSVVALSPTDAPNASATSAQIGATPLAQNNSTIHQENPDNVQSDDDLSGLQGWLAGHLSSRLDGSTVKIEQGQYKKAHSVLGERYDDLLGKYVEVSGQTDEKKDDKIANNLQNTQKNQQEYVSKVQRYHTLHDRYQQAKQNGNDAKARRIAHKLNRLSKEIGQSSGNLTSSYDRLSNNTNVSTAKETGRIQNVTRNISQQQAVVREKEFVHTNLTVSLKAHDVSFVDPIELTGQLTDENGTGIANQSIRLQLGGNRSRRTAYQTNEDGEFTLTGRPAVATPGRHSFRVEYQPPNDSAYLGSNRTVQVDVSQVPSNITITEHTKRAGYNDTVSVSGHVRAEQLVAGDVPVAISIGDKRLGTTRTAPNGSFSFNSTLPTNVSAKKHDLRVSFPFRDRALTAKNATAPITVRPTATNLTITGENGKTRNVDLYGRLRTATGTSLPNQRVTIFANGTQVATTRTDENGTYRVSAVVPSSAVSADGNTSFVARFDGHGMNVKSARASKTLTVVPDDAGLLDSETRGWLVGLGVAGLITLSGFLLWRSNFGGGSDTDDDDPTDATVSTTSPSDDSTDPSSSLSAMAFLDSARSARDAGEFQTAVERGYAATRNRFGNVVPTTASTHWEFYHACREAGLSDETLSAIGDITERYEESAFAERQISRETATAVIDTISSLIEQDTTPTPTAPEPPKTSGEPTKLLGSPALSTMQESATTGGETTTDTISTSLTLGEPATLGDGLITNVGRYRFESNYKSTETTDVTDQRFLFVGASVKNPTDKRKEIPADLSIYVTIDGDRYEPTDYQGAFPSLYTRRSIDAGQMRIGILIFEVPEDTSKSDVLAGVEYSDSSGTVTIQWSSE